MEQQRQWVAQHILFVKFGSCYFCLYSFTNVLLKPLTSACIGSNVVSYCSRQRAVNNGSSTASDQA